MAASLAIMTPPQKPPQVQKTDKRDRNTIAGSPRQNSHDVKVRRRSLGSLADQSKPAETPPSISRELRQSSYGFDTMGRRSLKEISSQTLLKSPRQSSAKRSQSEEQSSAEPSSPPKVTVKRFGRASVMDSPGCGNRELKLTRSPRSEENISAEFRQSSVEHRFLISKASAISCTPPPAIDSPPPPPPVSKHQTPRQLASMDSSPKQQTPRQAPSVESPAKQQASRQVQAAPKMDKIKASVHEVRKQIPNGTPDSGPPSLQSLGSVLEAVRKRTLHAQSPGQISPRYIVRPVWNLDADIRCAAAVVVDQSSSVWCGDRSGSLVVRDPETHATLSLFSQDVSAGDFVWCLMHERDYVWAGLSSGRLRVYCASSQKQVVERKKHARGIYALNWLGEFAYSASGDCTIIEWLRTTWEPTNRLFGEHMDQVRCLCTCVGRLVSGGDDNYIRVWQVGNTVKSDGFRRNASIFAVTSVPKSTHLASPGGELGTPESLWAGDGQGELSFYDLLEIRSLGSIGGHTGAICHLLYENGFVFSSSEDKTIKIWVAATQCCVQILDTHTSYVSGLLRVPLSTEIRLWSFGGDKRLCSWNMECSCLGVDEFDRSCDRSLERANRLVQEKVDSKPTKRSLKTKEQDVGRSCADFEARQAEMSKVAQTQGDEIERLTVTLKLREKSLEKVRQDLVAAQAENLALRKEAEGSSRKLEEGLAWGLAAKLADAKNESSTLRVELQVLRAKYDASQQELLQRTRISESLREQLADAIKKGAIAEERSKVLEERLADKKGLQRLQSIQSNGENECAIIVSQDLGYDVIRDPCEYLIEEGKTIATVEGRGHPAEHG